MKRHIIIMYMALLLLTGCSQRQTGWQTGDVTLVRAVGVDRLEEGVRVSAVAGRTEDGATASALQADGPSIADGIRELGAKGDGFVHFGHVDQLLLGEEFVRDGVEPLLDFLARDRQIGPGVQLWVLRGGAAERTMTSEYDVSARLERLAEDQRGVAPKVDCTATRLMSVMARRGSVPVPALQREGESLQSVGYAILRQGRLVGFLDGEQSLGVELLCGQGADQAVDAVLSDGKRIVLKTKRTAVTCVPTFENGRLRGLDLRCTARLDVVQGASLTERQRRQVKQQAELELCGRMASALAFAQLWDADFVGLEQMARAACSGREWDTVDWRAEFRALVLQAVADVQVDWPPDMMEELE